MFRYPDSVCWVDGVFLRPHHFQQVQQEYGAARASDRALALPYAWGVRLLEADEAALEQFSFAVERLQAILPGGAEVDLPGNGRADALDLSGAVESGARRITVYVAVPPLREGECNLAEEGAFSAPRRYEPVAREHYDLNAGGNERPVMHRRLMVLFVTDPEDAPGYEKMALVRYECRRDSDGRPSLLPDREFAGPALCLSGNPELGRRLGALFIHLEKIGMNLVSSLRHQEMQAQEKLHVRMERMVKAGLVQSSLAVLRHLAAPFSAALAPLYGELCRLMVQLAAFRPLEDCAAPEAYVHDDCMPQFTAVIGAIYRLTASEATEWCVRVELERSEEADAWFGALDAGWIPAVRAVYVGIEYRSQPRRIADLVEAGDAFKLTAASMANSRVRGVRLAEDRYPSPLLPVDANRLWFRAEKPEDDDTWCDIADEGRCAVAWSPQMLPGIKAELFLILSMPDQDR